MKRRSFLKQIAIAATGVSTLSRSPIAAEPSNATAGSPASSRLDPASAKDWLDRWEKHITSAARTRYCDRELGEEIGWLISPFLNGFRYGYQATGDTRWIERLTDWAGAWIKRGVKEPDGFIGWPKSGSGGKLANELLTDSLLGEAMGLTPLVLMAGEILESPALQEKFGQLAEDWRKLAERTFEKWDARGCWREVKEGGLWAVPAFGIDPKTGTWTEGYDRRKTDGFSNPANKQNHIARWLLALHDVTGKSVYRERAEQWFRLMKSRMRTRAGGKFLVWNYWDPAGPWDYKPDGSPRHWVGVHPNGGYYAIDVEGIVAAFEHGLVFDKEDIQRLVVTNRDFMWNQQLQGAQFQRIDGDEPDARWKNSPGLLWAPLVPYDETLRKIFLANHNPASWGGLVITTCFLAHETAASTAKP